MGESTRRSRILEVAARLVIHYGPAKTTVTDIAREAGVSVGAVYLEFPSKEQIVLALAESRYDRVLHALRQALSGPDPLESRIRRAFDVRLEVFLGACDEGTHGNDLIACESSPVRTAERRYLEEEHALFEANIRKAAGAGEIWAPDPTLTTRALLRCYATFRPPALRSCDREGLAECMGEVHRLVARGLLERRTG